MAKRLSRREFHKALLAAGTLPVLRRTLDETQESSALSGYVPTAEEQMLGEAFLASHVKRMSPLREQDLPNSLPPAIIFASPAPRKKSGK